MDCIPGPTFLQMRTTWPAGKLLTLQLHHLNRLPPFLQAHSGNLKGKIGMTYRVRKQLKARKSKQGQNVTASRAITWFPSELESQPGRSRQGSFIWRGCGPVVPSLYCGEMEARTQGQPVGFKNAIYHALCAHEMSQSDPCQAWSAGPVKAYAW